MPELLPSQTPQFKFLLAALRKPPRGVDAETCCNAFKKTMRRLPELKCEEVESAFLEACGVHEAAAKAA